MLVFVVTSMAAMGLSLTLDRVIRPLRDLRLVALLPAANFVAVPAVAIAVSQVLPMDDTSAAAVVLIGACAAPRSCPSWRCWPRATSPAGELGRRTAERAAAA